MGRGGRLGVRYSLIYISMCVCLLYVKFQMAETFLSALSDHFSSTIGRRRTLVTAAVFAVFLLTSLVLVAQVHCIHNRSQRPDLFTVPNNITL